MALFIFLDFLSLASFFHFVPRIYARRLSRSPHTVFSMPCRRGLSLVVFTALGVPLALIESVPYMMVGMFSPHDKHGQLLGKLNVWIGERLVLR